MSLDFLVYNRVIPVLWLSFVCKWRVGEVGHLVKDLEVLFALSLWAINSAQ